MDRRRLQEILQNNGDPFVLHTGRPAGPVVYECNTYDKNGNLVKTEAPRLDRAALKDIELLKNDKILRRWVEFL